MFRRSNPCGNPDDHILEVQVVVTTFPEPAAMLLKSFGVILIVLIGKDQSVTPGMKKGDPTGDGES
jgi:hypothetical protein